MKNTPMKSVIDRPTRDGQVPICIAIQKKNTDLVSELLGKFKPDIMLVDSTGNRGSPGHCALDYASKTGSSDISKLLEKYYHQNKEYPSGNYQQKTSSAYQYGQTSNGGKQKQDEQVGSPGRQFLNSEQQRPQRQRAEERYAAGPGSPGTGRPEKRQKRERDQKR